MNAVSEAVRLRGSIGPATMENTSLGVAFALSDLALKALQQPRDSAARMALRAAIEAAWAFVRAKTEEEERLILAVCRLLEEDQSAAERMLRTIEALRVARRCETLP